MPENITKEPPPSLTGLAQKLFESVQGLRPLFPGGTSPRDDLLLLLRLKILPELEAHLKLPVFVGIQGGTNSGKSTVFNALIGKLLSPAVVLASATKHPLAFLHARWRPAFLDRQVFSGIELKEMADPKELIVDPERTDLL